MNKVLPGLYIGSARDAHDGQELWENKISHILSIHENAKPDLPDKAYLCLSVADNPTQDIMSYFPSTNCFIHKARRTGNVLVHCQLGVSRSATIVVAYIMTVTRLGWKDALAALKAVRPFVNPNLGFQKQLMVYEQKHVEDERIRLKTVFPLSQFNDVCHCEQLLEKYRLNRLRNEQPMDVDVYPLALDAYGAKDFESLRHQANPAGVVFCGPASNPNSEEDCLVQRLDRLHLGETFKSRDTFSCGNRPTSNFIVKTKSPEVNTPSTRSLNDVQGNGSVASENPLLSGLLDSAVMREYAPNDKKSSNDAAVDMLFRNSVDASKNSAKSDDHNSSLPRGAERKQSLNENSLEMIFKNSVNASKNSAKNGSLLSTSPVNEAMRESGLRDPKSSDDDTLEILFKNSVNASKKPAKNGTPLSTFNEAARESGLRDPKPSDDDDTLEMWFKNSMHIPKISEKNGTKKSTTQESKPQQTVSSNDAAIDSIFLNSVGGSRNSLGSKQGSASKEPQRETKVPKQFTEKALREIGRPYIPQHLNVWRGMSDEDDDDDKQLSAVRTTNNNPSQFKTKSRDPTELITITSNGPAQNKIVNDDTIRLVKITNNVPTQTTVTNSNFSRKTITGNGRIEVIKVTNNDPLQATTASSDPSQRRLSGNSEEMVTVLPRKSQLDRLLHD